MSLRISFIPMGRWTSSCCPCAVSCMAVAPWAFLYRSLGTVLYLLSAILGTHNHRTFQDWIGFYDSGWNYCTSHWKDHQPPDCILWAASIIQDLLLEIGAATPIPLSTHTVETLLLVAFAQCVSFLCYPLLLSTERFHPCNRQARMWSLQLELQLAPKRQLNETIRHHFSATQIFQHPDVLRTICTVWCQGCPVTNRQSRPHFHLHEHRFWIVLFGYVAWIE